MRVLRNTLVLAVVAVACDSATSSEMAIGITPSAPITLDVGQIATVSAVVSGGATNTTRAVTYTSTAPAVAAVDATTGVVTAVSPGTTTIVARSVAVSDLRSSVQVTVLNNYRPVVTPSPIDIEVGARQALAITILDAIGQPVSGRTVTHVMGNATVASVVDNEIEGLSVGSTTLQTTVNGEAGRSAQTAVNVRAPRLSVSIDRSSVSLTPGGSVTLTCTARNANNNAVVPGTFDWTSSDTAVAVVNASGQVNGVADGTATIRCDAGGTAAASAQVTVTTPPLVITAQPNPVTLEVGRTVIVQITVRDENGLTVTGRSIAYASANSAVATVASDGTISGVTQGTTSLTVTVAGPGGGSIIVPVTVIAPVLEIVPGLAASAPGGTTSFSASASSGATPGVVWRVNGVTGGNATLGTISASGIYTAPAVLPNADSVVIGAVLAADTSVRRSATVLFLPSGISTDYYVAVPRVADATIAAGVRIVVVPPPTAATVAFLPLVGAATPLKAIGGGAFVLELTGAQALAGYVPGRLHNGVGQFDYRTAGGSQVKLTNQSVNVRDASMPSVNITPLAADAQRSPYVLNLRVDAATIYPQSSVVNRALQLLGGDRFDFVAVIATVNTNNNRIYSGVRNDVAGIGLSLFDNSATWGGRGRLRGTIGYPIEAFFDGADRSLTHEIGHAWINHAVDAVLGPGAPHWPRSTMARRVMGFNIPGSNVGGMFPWELIPVGNGNVRVQASTASDSLAPLDLYAMGLLPPDSVPPMWVLPQSASSLFNGQILSATQYTIDDYIAAHGQRLPASTTAQREFHIAVVVLSYGRLLGPAEMAFFDHAAARAETTVPLPYSIGLSTGIASGFHNATGRRATLRARLVP